MRPYALRMMANKKEIDFSISYSGVSKKWFGDCESGGSVLFVVFGDTYYDVVNKLYKFMKTIKQKT